MKYKNNLKKEGAVHLSKKEKIMLNMLLRNGRTFNTAIARKLKISSQVTGRIRRKLERNGVIRGYSIELNNQFLGVRTLVLARINMDGRHEEKLMTKNLVGLYKVLGNSATHIAVYGFIDLKESDDYFHSIVEHSENIKIIDTCALPLEGLIKHSPKNLFYNALRGFDGCGSYHDYPKNKNRIRLKKLTFSEKNVLISLVKNSNVSCKKMSSSLPGLNLTSAGAYMVKNRLEDQNIIKRYNINLDYEKLGVNIFAFIFLIPKPESLKQEDILIKKCRDSLNVIDCYRLNEEVAMFCGFRNLNELEDYCDGIRDKFSDFVQIKNVFIISPRGIIKESFDDLYLSLLEK